MLKRWQTAALIVAIWGCSAALGIFALWKIAKVDLTALATLLTAIATLAVALITQNQLKHNRVVQRAYVNIKFCCSILSNFRSHADTP
jgi:hypothetical protein